MVIAKGVVIVGDKRYEEGQTVHGLSPLDIARMSREGFIEVHGDIRKEPAKKSKEKRK